MNEDGLVYWSPWAEASWNIPTDILGPAPRDARRYHPPLSTTSQVAPWIMTVVVAIPTVWLVQRFLAAESMAAPLTTLSILGVAGALVLWGPKLITNNAPRRSVDVELQLRLARGGRAVCARVASVAYARTTTRSGYRDGTALDTRSGVAKLAFDTADGSQSVELDFDPNEPSLQDGDEVTLVYLEDDPSVWLPVYRMNDIELRCDETA